MDWTKILAELSVFLSDDKVGCDVAEFLNVISYKLEVDEDEIVFPFDTQFVVEERAMVQNSSVKGGGYFVVKCALFSSPSEDGGISQLGKFKIMYDLDGIYQDDFYSRD